MATNQGGSEIVAAVLSFPENEAERRARVAYAIVFVLAKSCALALTFIPPSGELAQVLFGLSIANFLIGFLMDACARRETKRWAGNRGPESRFTVCLLETIPGLDVAKTLGSAVTTRISHIRVSEGGIHLEDDSEAAAQATESKALTAMERWSHDISTAYEYSILTKKLLSGTIVVLRYLYDNGHYKDKRLDITARVISSFVSLILVDIIDGLSKEESRLRSTATRDTGLFNKVKSLFG